MRTTARRARIGASVILLAWSFTATAEAKDDKVDKARLLTRSIYLPVEFALCDHLENAVLYLGEVPVSVLPAKRIFQFTYYPNLARIEPMRTDVRVEGRRADGSDFIGRLAVTPFGVFTANTKIELDMQAQLEKMRYKLDTRYEKLTLRLRCSDSCTIHGPAAVTADAGSSQHER
jgi:hypothetical protein